MVLHSCVKGLWPPLLGASMNNEFLIFTDLDGTLLNHDNYSFSAASTALEMIQERKIPLIIATSKTFCEVKKLQLELGISAPCIVENGAGIFIPSSCVLANGDWHADEEDWIKVSHSKSYLESRLFLNSMKKKYALRGFGDMALEEIVRLTGLEEEQAADARKRDFTEPFIIEDDRNILSLTQEANALGFDIVQGGRFFHLITMAQDKSKAMLSVKLLYEEYFKHSFRTIALGDSHNDFTMLIAAEFGVLIPKSDGTYASFRAPDLIRAPFAGAKGWNTSVLGILDAN